MTEQKLLRLSQLTAGASQVFFVLAGTYVIVGLEVILAFRLIVVEVPHYRYHCGNPSQGKQK